MCLSVCSFGCLCVFDRLVCDASFLSTCEFMCLSVRLYIRSICVCPSVSFVFVNLLCYVFRCRSTVSFVSLLYSWVSLAFCSRCVYALTHVHMYAFVHRRLSLSLYIYLLSNLQVSRQPGVRCLRSLRVSLALMSPHRDMGIWTKRLVEFDFSNSLFNFNLNSVPVNRWMWLRWMSI